MELGGVMGATSTTAVTGTGLLGRFYFVTLDEFAGETDLTLSHVFLHTLRGPPPLLIWVVRLSKSGA